MFLHIGNLIKEVMDTRGMGVTDLARAIYCSRTNVYKILTKNSIDTALLQRICLALDYNFFKDLAQRVEEVPAEELVLPLPEMAS